VNLNRLVRKLREEAEIAAENRRICEYGPGGGNPTAKAQDHLEWLAADQIVALRKLCGELAEALVEFSENDMYTDATADLVERGRAVDM
jgi:hypothetical protein